MNRVIAFVRDKLLGLALDAAQGQILGVARALLGLVGDEQDALTAIGAQVSDAANAHLEAGRLQVNRAVEAERPDADRDHLLREARSNLQLFVSNASVPHASRSFAYIYLYLTDIALRNRRDAERDLRTAHLEAARAALVVDQSPFARPVWVKTELVDYLNALGDFDAPHWGILSPSPPDSLEVSATRVTSESTTGATGRTGTPTARRATAGALTCFSSPHGLVWTIRNCFVALSTWSTRERRFMSDSSTSGSRTKRARALRLDASVAYLVQAATRRRDRASCAALAAG